MIYVIVGKMASGKTTFAKELENKGVERIITYTTRPKRKYELYGIDYHFVTDDIFNTLLDAHSFLETREYHASFGDCRYGSLFADYICDKKKKKVIILNPSGVEKLYKMRKHIPKKLFFKVIYLDYPDELLLDRATKRGDDIREVKRRLKADAEDFKKLEAEHMYDYRITNQHTKQLTKLKILL